MRTLGWVVSAVPAVAVVAGWVWMVSLVAAPTTSVNVPKLVVPPVTPAMVAVPLFVIFPVASGVPAEGRTRTFCHVSVFGSRVLTDVIVIVRVDAVRVTAIVEPLARLLMFLVEFASPVTRTVGAVPPVSNTNPVGALKIIVPVVEMSPLAVSVYIGPVSAA